LQAESDVISEAWKEEALDALAERDAALIELRMLQEKHQDDIVQLEASLVGNPLRTSMHCY